MQTPPLFRKALDVNRAGDQEWLVQKLLEANLLPFHMTMLKESKILRKMMWDFLDKLQVGLGVPCPTNCAACKWEDCYSAVGMIKKDDPQKNPQR